MHKLSPILLTGSLLFGTAALASSPLEERTAALATRYLQVWSAHGPASVRSVPSLYEKWTTFYGRTYTHQELIAEKRRAIRRWPIRHYAHHPGTMRVRCDVPNRRCVAHSIIDFRVANPHRGALKHGSAKFVLGINFAPPNPRIFYEGGSVNAPKAMPRSRSS